MKPLGKGSPLPPEARGWPLLGQLFPLVRNPQQFLVDKYREHGPIFRLNLVRRRFTVIAGPEGNLFMTRGGALKLINREAFGSMAKHLGTDNLVVSIDGARHTHVRRMLRPGYSRELIEQSLPLLVETVEAMARAIPPGQSVPVRTLLQRLVTEQLSLAILGRSSKDVLPDAALFASVLVGSNFGRWSRWRLQMPKYRAAKSRMMQLARDILEERRKHGPNLDRERGPDLVDIALAARDLDGKPYSQADVDFVVAGPFLAGMDTAASTAAFQLYELLARPALYERVVAEVDQAFSNGIPTAQDVRRMKLLRGTLLETLRLHPICFVLMRHAAESFEFAGHRVEAGEEVWVAPTVSHFLEALFPEPNRFDPERYEQPRCEDKQPGAYAPFGLGPHVCMGAGQAELVMMLALATLLRTARLAIDPPGRALVREMAPLPTPVMGCRVRVLEHRESPRVGGRSTLENLAWVLPTLDRKLLAEVAAQAVTGSHGAGAEIIREGDAADRFYMILEGEVEVVAQGRSLAKLHGGDYFGERGLLTGATRNATVRALTPVKTVELEREGFLKMVNECDLTSQELARVMRERVIANRLSITLPSLDGARAAALTPLVAERSHARGEAIVQQGDAAEAFYILTRGTCEVTCHPAGGGREAVVNRLVEGDYFGEIGLLHGIPRTATVRVTSEGGAEVLAIDKEHFRALIADVHLTPGETARIMRLGAELRQREREGGGEPAA